MVSQPFHRENPDAVRGLVRAINRGLADVVADPEAATDAVVRRNPSMDRIANRARLRGTLALEMAHPEGAIRGIGDPDEDRLRQAIAVISAAKKLAAPALSQIFDRSFLPPLSERVTALARP